MPSTIPELDREFDAEKRRQIVIAERMLQDRIGAERDKVMNTEPRPTSYTKFVDGRPSNRDDDVKLLP